MRVVARSSNVQCGIFINGLPPNRLKLAAEIVESIPELKPNPLILPIPDDAPAEAPRLLLDNDGATLRCIVSLTRADFFASGLAPADLAPAVDRSIKLAGALIAVGTSINRIGWVSTTLLDLDKPSLDHLGGLFPRSLLQEGAVEVELSGRAVVEVAGQKSNCWVRAHSLPKGFPNPTTSQLEVVIDHNTVPSEGRELSLDIVQNYLQQAMALQWQEIRSRFIGEEVQ